MATVSVWLYHAATTTARRHNTIINNVLKGEPVVFQSLN